MCSDSSDKTAESSERVFILGGGDIALMLAELLEKKVLTQ